MLTAIQVISLKSERAKKHISDLKGILDSFLKGNPYRLGFKDDTKAGERIFYVEKCTDVPPGIMPVVGDALHNLRSTLDYLIYQLVLANGATPTNFTSFPIADSAAEYVTPKFRRKIQGLRQEAIDRLDVFKPYKGGNDLLWKLGKLNNRDKHRILLAAATSHMGHSPKKEVRERVVAMFLASNPGAKKLAAHMYNFMYFPTDSPFPLQVGQEILRWPIAELDEYVQFGFDIAFNEPKISERESILETLKTHERSRPAYCQKI